VLDAVVHLGLDEREDRIPDQECEHQDDRKHAEIDPSRERRFDAVVEGGC
jgi:hypothetical protein